MVTRIHFDDGEDADALADLLYSAGHEVAVVRERCDGEYDAAIDYVVATPATPEQLHTLAPDLPEDIDIEADDVEPPAFSEED